MNKINSYGGTKKVHRHLKIFILLMPNKGVKMSGYGNENIISNSIWESPNFNWLILHTIPMTKPVYRQDALNQISYFKLFTLWGNCLPLKN